MNMFLSLKYAAIDMQRCRSIITTISWILIYDNIRVTSIDVDKY